MREYNESMPKNSVKKITLDDLAAKTDNLATTIDDLAAMCMREFTRIHETMATKGELNSWVEKMEKKMDLMGIRLDNISEIVLEDHKPRIRALEMQVFTD
jgi:hypothetical protein